MLGSAYSSYSTPGGFNNYQQSLGVSGGNPLRPLMRRIETGLGDWGGQRTAFVNELEPGFQSTIRHGIASNQPGRQQSLIQNYANMLRGLQIPGLQDSGLRGQEQGLGSGTTQGYYENALNPLNSGLMGYARYVHSPEFQQGQLQNLLGLYGAGQNLGFAQTLSGLEGNRQQSNMMKDQGTDFMGGLLGIGGQMAGAGAFNNLFR